MKRQGERPQKQWYKGSEEAPGMRTRRARDRKGLRKEQGEKTGREGEEGSENAKKVSDTKALV